mmetsp:Transcript_27459/g.31328  ORF Transcript_27459/g.31328 Transcript_27459/m.31328 type:complete len:196 (-) Transcript_27459:85-672(-)|eukprot:CAMPEP_0194151814 /NCGR_PEP_ID=MMETSP0152-20130528/49628_1 /TAXON_ID=1049557 /ORGANISM="Thalassiothrix antarctica, Strain L6-D1" /LENGTH=195 /DNA_ID=CAMNT_0038855889 /DNA_START=18 /DNA_END=605 /DNA_ORIENTATION=+
MDEETKSRIAQSTRGFDFVLHDLCSNEDWAEVRSCVKIFETTAKVPNRCGDLPLHIALSKGCPQDVAESLVAAYPQGAHTRNSQNQYPLLLADTAYSVEFLTSLITPETARGINAFGETALMSSVSKGYSVALISSLLSANPDAIREPDEMDNLPLHEAVEKGNVNVIKIVYEAYPEAAKIENGMGELVTGFWNE